MPKKKKQKTAAATRSRQSSPVGGQLGAPPVGTEAITQALELEVQQNMAAGAGGGGKKSGRDGLPKQPPPNSGNRRRANKRRNKQREEAEKEAARATLRNQATERRTKFGTPKEYVSFIHMTRSTYL